MASEVHVQYTCDMQLHAGKPVEAIEREISIMVGEVMIELDLCAKCMKELAGKFAPYMEAGRPVSKRDPRVRALTRRRPDSGNSRNGRGSTRPSEIRAWANSQGYSLSARGRIPEEVQAAYKAAVGT